MCFKVLIVDDEPGFLDQAKIFLEKLSDDLKICTADSANEALSCLKKKDFDAMISDYHMPNIDGIQLLDIIREKGMDLPFILFTGIDNQGLDEKAISHGADGFVRKKGKPSEYYHKLINILIEGYR